MLTDYHIIRRAKLKLSDLYTSDPAGIYWFERGVNWRAIVAFLMGVWPLLRKSPKSPLLASTCFVDRISHAAGLIETVNAVGDPTSGGWARLYHLTFLVGLAIGASVFWVLNYFFPPPGLGMETPFMVEEFYGVPQPTTPGANGGSELSEESLKQIGAVGEKQLSEAKVSA